MTNETIKKFVPDGFLGGRGWGECPPFASFQRRFFAIMYGEQGDQIGRIIFAFWATVNFVQLV
jgi:hypothetical protein